MVGATRRLPDVNGSATAPTFRNDEVEAQRCRWTFYETIRIPLP
jgi:hypothetical protein